MANWQARASRIQSRTGHNAHDSQCMYWRGDFAGVNLGAHCFICDPEPVRQPNRVIRALRVLLGRE